MKYIAIMLLCAAILTACNKPPEADVRFVTAVAGLNLRSGPSGGAAPIKLVPAGSPVTFLEEQAQDSEWQGLRGRWMRVRFENSEGWVFGAFVTKNKPPRATGEWTDCGIARGFVNATFSADGGYKYGDSTGGASVGSYQESGDVVSVTSRSISAPAAAAASTVYRFQPDGSLCNEAGATCWCRR